MVNATSAFLAEAQTARPEGASQAEDQASALPVVGPDAIAITLHINGTPRALRVEPHTTLAEALRGQDLENLYLSPAARRLLQDDRG